MKPFHGRTLIANALEQIATQLLGIDPKFLTIVDAKGQPLPGNLNVNAARKLLGVEEAPTSKRSNDRKVKANTSIQAAGRIAAAKIQVPEIRVRIVTPSGHKMHKDAKLARARKYSSAK